MISIDDVASVLVAFAAAVHAAAHLRRAVSPVVAWVCKVRKGSSMSRAKPRFNRTNPQLPAAVPNLFELVVRGEIENQLTINTFYYADGGVALTPTTEADIATAWVTLNGLQYRNFLSSDWTGTDVKVQCLTSPSRMPGYANYASPGGGPAGHEPTNVGVTFLRMSGIKGQAGRGRITTPAVPSGWVTASTLNATGDTAAAAFGPLLDTAFLAGARTMTPQIVSRHNKNGPPLGASPVLSWNVNRTMGSCRRRKLGRGK